MAATGFAYAPNEALQARMAHLAAEGKLVLGDAQDPGIRACLTEARLSECLCRATSIALITQGLHFVLLYAQTWG